MTEERIFGMKKVFFKRAVIGAMIGVFINVFISVIISYCVNDGNYYPVVPQLAEVCGGTTNAVAVQTVVTMIYGALMAGISVIWELERWSLLRQTITHFAVCSAMTLPVAYFMQWIEQSLLGVLGYFGIFAAVYVVIWVVVYFRTREKINQMNTLVEEFSIES